MNCWNTSDPVLDYMEATGLNRTKLGNLFRSVFSNHPASSKIIFPVIFRFRWVVEWLPKEVERSAEAGVRQRFGHRRLDERDHPPGAHRQPAQGGLHHSNLDRRRGTDRLLIRTFPISPSLLCLVCLFPSSFFFLALLRLPLYVDGS